MPLPLMLIGWTLPAARTTDAEEMRFRLFSFVKDIEARVKMAGDSQGGNLTVPPLHEPAPSHDGTEPGEPTDISTVASPVSERSEAAPTEVPA